MPHPLLVDAIPAKFDRIYKARGEGDAVYDVNVARLECTCPEWLTSRSTFAVNDVRRVCSHVLEKLYTTKVEKGFTLLQQLFVRYGRTMQECQVVEDALGVFVVGQPFGPTSVRAIGSANDKPVLATYRLGDREWQSGESDLSADLYAGLLVRMRAVLPHAFQ